MIAIHKQAGLGFTDTLLDRGSAEAVEDGARTSGSPTSGSSGDVLNNQGQATEISDEVSGTASLPEAFCRDSTPPSAPAKS